MKKKLFFILILLMPIFLYSQTESRKDTSKTDIYDTKANPFDNLKKAIKIAQKTNKKILLQVGGNWCPWCKKLHKLFSDNKQISEILKKNFIVIYVNYSKENKNESFLSRYPKIEGYPHIFILNKKGELLHSQNTGDLETGDHHDPDKVIKFLSEWAKK